MEEGVRSPWRSMRAEMEQGWSPGAGSREHHPPAGKVEKVPTIQSQGGQGRQCPCLQPLCFRASPPCCFPRDGVSGHASLLYFPKFSPHNQGRCQAEAGHSSHLLPAGVSRCSKVTEFVRIVEHGFTADCR